MLIKNQTYNQQLFPNKVFGPPKQAIADTTPLPPKDSYVASGWESDSTRAALTVGKTALGGALLGSGVALARHVANAASPVAGTVLNLAVGAAGFVYGACELSDGAIERSGSKAFGRLIGGTFGMGAAAMIMGSSSSATLVGSLTGGALAGGVNGMLHLMIKPAHE